MQNAKWRDGGCGGYIKFGGVSLPSLSSPSPRGRLAGSPVYRLCQWGPKPDSLFVTGDREGRPSGFMGPLSETWRACEDTRPYSGYRSPPFFCRGRTPAGPSVALQLSPARQRLA